MNEVPNAETHQIHSDSDDARQASPKPKQSWVEGLRKLDKWWAILVLLFCVTGVLGVPVLWVSRAFGPVMKIVLTIVVTLYTAFLFWLVYLVWMFAYNSITGSVSY